MAELNVMKDNPYKNPTDKPELDEAADLKQRLAEAEAALNASAGMAREPSDIQLHLDTEEALRLSEERYRALFNNMTEGFATHEIVCDGEGKPCDYRFLEINPAFERLTGLKREQTIGKLASEVIPGLEPFWIEKYGEVALTGHPVQFERYSQPLDRHYRVYAYCYSPGKFAVIFMDITESKQIQLQLNEVAEKYSTMFNATSDGFWINNLGGVILEVNDAYCQMSGYGRDELTRMHISVLEACETPDEIAAHIVKILEQDGHDRFESMHRRKDGSMFDVDVTALYYDKEGGRIAIFVRDITKRKQVEDALRDSERRLRRAEEISHLGSWELDLNNNRLIWSDEVYRMFGFQPHEFSATYEAFLQAVHPDDRAAVDAAYSNSIRDGCDSYEIEHRLVNQLTNEVRIVHEKCIHFRDESGKVIRSEGMVHDITEHKLAEQALRQARDELELRVQERTQELNRANDQLRAEVTERQKAQTELEHSLKGLQIIEEELRNNNAMLLNVQHELQNALQNERDTHDQLVQAEKFAAVGRLLASITHEINNPLQTIKNCLFLSQGDILSDSPIYEYLKMAITETDRLSNLVAQLREIYRPPTQGQIKPVNLPILVDEVHTLLAGYLHEKHITWMMTAPDDRLYANLIIEGVSSQLKQVFLNISLNAIDAMEPNGGRIMINFLTSEDNSQVGICFQDSGPGLPQEVKDRLFEPFLTTKEKGLGLGLAICYDIIQKHNGQIEVESEPGEGAAFTVWLPATRSNKV